MIALHFRDSPQDILLQPRQILWLKSVFGSLPFLIQQCATLSSYDTHETCASIQDLIHIIYVLSCLNQNVNRYYFIKHLIYQALSFGHSNPLVLIRFFYGSLGRSRLIPSGLITTPVASFARCFRNSASVITAVSTFMVGFTCWNFRNSCMSLNIGCKEPPSFVFRRGVVPSLVLATM